MRASLESGIWKGTLALALLLAVGGARAQDACGPANDQGVRDCAVGLDTAAVARIAQPQAQSQWCWAASIAMLLAHHGVHVAQEELVKERFGAAVDRRATGEDVTRLLERTGTDAQGRTWRMEARVSDALARQFAVTQDALLDELRAGRPVLVGVRGHMMLLVGLRYEVFTHQGGWRISGGTVVDPADARGVRPLQRDEFRPTYLAAVRSGNS